jgi:hypothetical protein
MTLGDIIQQKYDEAYRRKMKILNHLLEIHKILESKMTQPTDCDPELIQFNLSSSGKLEIQIAARKTNLTKLLELAKDIPNVSLCFTNMIIDESDNIESQFNLSFNNLTLYFKSVELYPTQSCLLFTYYAK